MIVRKRRTHIATKMGGFDKELLILLSLGMQNELTDEFDCRYEM